MEVLVMIFDYLGYILGGLLTVLCLIAVIRVLKKSKKGEAVHVEPVGVFQDLPDTVTGLGKIEVAQEKCRDEQIK